MGVLDVTITVVVWGTGKLLYIHWLTMPVETYFSFSIVLMYLVASFRGGFYAPIGFWLWRIFSGSTMGSTMGAMFMMMPSCMMLLHFLPMMGI
jgi:hypothetical protein